MKRVASIKAAAELRAVLRYAERWGVKIEFRAHHAPHDHARRASHIYSVSTDTISDIDWNTRTVWFGDDLKDAKQRCALLHEINHVVVGIDPDSVEEVDSGMLALDYYVARSAKLSGWRAWMNTYTLIEGEWPTVSTQERSKALVDSFWGAIRAGLMNPRTGRPTYRRF